MKKITLTKLWTQCVALEKAVDKLETSIGDLEVMTYYSIRFADEVIRLLDQLVLTQLARPTTTLQVDTPGAYAFQVKVPVESNDLTAAANSIQYDAGNLEMEMQGKQPFLVINMRFD